MWWAWFAAGIVLGAGLAIMVVSLISMDRFIRALTEPRRKDRGGK